MFAYYNGNEVFTPLFNDLKVAIIIKESTGSETQETTAKLGTAVLGKMILGTGE